MQTPLSPLAGCGSVGEGTSGKVLNWTVHSLNHAYTTNTTMGSPFIIVLENGPEVQATLRGDILAGNVINNTWICITLLHLSSTLFFVLPTVLALFFFLLEAGLEGVFTSASPHGPGSSEPLLSISFFFFWKIKLLLVISVMSIQQRQKFYKCLYDLTPYRH